MRALLHLGRIPRRLLPVTILCCLSLATPGRSQQQEGHSPGFGDQWANSPWHSMPTTQLQWRWLACTGAFPDPACTSGMIESCGVQLRSTDGIAYTGEFQFQYLDRKRGPLQQSLQNYTVGGNPRLVNIGDFANGGTCIKMNNVLPNDVKGPTSTSPSTPTSWHYGPFRIPYINGQYRNVELWITSTNGVLKSTEVVASSEGDPLAGTTTYQVPLRELAQSLSSMKTTYDIMATVQIRVKDKIVSYTSTAWGGRLRTDRTDYLQWTLDSEASAQRLSREFQALLDQFR
jgi:hypothetical protein